MEVHLLGTAGYHPNENRHTACMMIPEAGIILDAGSGFFRVRDLIMTSELHIFLSHCHLDHCIGLSFFIDVIDNKKVDNVFVYGQPEKLQAIQKHLFSQHLFPLKPNFYWTPIQAGQGPDSVSVPLGGKVTWVELKHPGSSLGFRIDWPDRSFAYITDTTASKNAGYISFIDGVDLLLHECHFLDGHEELAGKTGHSCLTPVAEVCRESQVKQCVIVHLNPQNEEHALDLDSVKTIFENLTLGTDRMVVNF